MSVEDVSGNGEFVADALAFQSRVRPDKEACVEFLTGESINYAQLDRLADQAAAWLDRNCREGERAAVMLRNSIDTIILFYGAMRAGRPLQALNWRLSAAEIAAIVEDARPQLLIFDSEFRVLAEAIPDAHRPRTLICRDERVSLREQICACPPVRLEPDLSEPALLLYTSGTTGRPKGAILTRANVFAGAVNFCQSFAVSERSRLRCDLPMYHVAALGVANASIFAGGTVFISDRFDADAAAAQLADPSNGITHYFAVPQPAAALLKAVDRLGGDYSSLYCLVIGGAPLAPEIVDGFAARGIIVTNTFGVTESAGTALAMPATREALDKHPGSCGVPTMLMDVRLVDHNGNDVRPGQVGELWLKGPAISPGYWGLDALAPDGWFRTGDAARVDEDGFYQIVDRWKDMYISGGENVYPAEIEIVLGKHPRIERAAVIGVPSAEWGEVGCAFVVRVGEEPLNPVDIMAWCKERLASFKCPKQIVLIDEIPMTSTGKPQKNLLRKLFRENVLASETVLSCVDGSGSASAEFG